MSALNSERLLAAAKAGGTEAFSELAEPFRAELLVHCYRMLGSAQDAEDMVQETMLRAWNRLQSFSGAQFFRAWLYKIATNVCLDALDKCPRRALSPAQFPEADPRLLMAPLVHEPIWLEPFPDELLAAVTSGPEARYSQHESITLAFLAALQLLPPRQRAILILCDVLEWQAREAAQLLEMTVATVNGLLRRARATLNNNFRGEEPIFTVDQTIRPTLNRYVQAWENGDVPMLVALLTELVVLTMPPSPTWFAGRDAVRIHAETMFAHATQAHMRFVETRANNRAAFACYVQGSDGLFHAYALHVLTLEGTQISEGHMFQLPQVFPRFGLAMTLAA